MKKTTTIFVSVDTNDDFRNDVYYLGDVDEIVDYIVKNYKMSDLTLVGNCPIDEETLNDWDDDLAEAEIFTEKEYERAIKKMNKLLNTDDSDTFIKEHWAVEVECSCSKFKKLLLEKIKEMLNQC